VSDDNRAHPEATVVTATQAGYTETISIRDNYVLVCDGTCYQHGVVVHRLKDGTETHVITVKGARR